MLASSLFLTTLKEDPADAVLVSHKLMVRAGLIRQLGSGLYSWLPLGLRILWAVEQIVREEMNRIGCLEMLMPCMQPGELWQESGRWEDYGPELIRMKDRHQRDFCLGPTHEEVITHIVRNEINSYKQLPLSVYQIHTKFRDEIRPRYGVMRGREFLMKDAYTFHLNEESLDSSYQDMRSAYIKIFTRLGVDFKVVAADSGSIGGHTSEEFHVLAASGEDAIAFSDTSDYAANVELAPTHQLSESCSAPSQPLKLIDTPGLYTIKALEEELNLPAHNGVKTLLLRAAGWTKEDPALIALLVRGDRELNGVKAENLPQVAKPLTMASQEEIKALIGCAPGSIGPVSLPVPCIADYELAQLSDFTCGANQDDKHYIGVNWERDCQLPPLADLRNITSGEPSPDGKGSLYIKRGIEVGHIFQLGDKYAEAMNAQVLDEDGRQRTLIMGCYGIGIDRIVAACIEQNHDDKGIIWPTVIAPFQVVLVPLGDQAVARRAMTLYQSLTEGGIKVLYDDRDLRAGVKFSDSDLLGIPYRLVISPKTLEKDSVECKRRRDLEPQIIPLAQILDWLVKEL